MERRRKCWRRHSYASCDFNLDVRHQLVLVGRYKAQQCLDCQRILEPVARTLGDLRTLIASLSVEQYLASPPEIACVGDLP